MVSEPTDGAYNPQQQHYQQITIWAPKKKVTISAPGPSNDQAHEMVREANGRATTYPLSMMEHIFLCLLSLALFTVPNILKERFQLYIPAVIEIGRA